MAATTDGENASKKSSDVFSMTDDALASRYKFEKEVRAPIASRRRLRSSQLRVLHRME